MGRYWWNRVISRVCWQLEWVIWLAVEMLTEPQSTLNILSQSTTVGERSNYLAGLGLSYVIGSLCGPVIGGAFVDGSAGWRWAFYLIAIIMGALLPVMLLALDSFDPYPGKPYTERIGIMDHIGALLMAAWVTFFIMAFTFAGAVWAWSAGGTITMFVLFGVFLVSFVVQQAFSILTTTENRLFPVQFLRSRTQILLFVCGAASGSVLFLAIYYVPIYFQFVHGTSGTSSAVHMLPLLCVGVTAVMLNGALMPKFGYYMPWFIASGVFMVTAGGLLVGDVDTNTPNSKMYGYTVLLGLASGTTQQAGYTISQAIVSQEQIPDAVAFMNTAQQGGMVIALAINGAIFQNEGFRRVKEVLVGTGINDQDIRAALAGAKSNMLERLDPGSRKRVIEAIVRTISDGWSLVIVAGGLCLISALLMKREKYV